MPAVLDALERPQQARPEAGRDGWRWAEVHTHAEGVPVSVELTAALKALGYAPTDVFSVRLALEEALANAIRHGHGGDPAKAVRVGYHADREQVEVEIEDEGDGFDPSAVAGPLVPECLERGSGRGLYLMRACMTWVRHNDRGNRVTLCKQRTS
jgi:serine/threonine-protein kinase RsbW